MLIHLLSKSVVLIHRYEEDFATNLSPCNIQIATAEKTQRASLIHLKIQRLEDLGDFDALRCALHCGPDLALCDKRDLPKRSATYVATIDTS
jgi:hypothetical protein